MLKTFFVEAKHSEKVGEVREKAEKLGFSWDHENPDFIVSVGGDGTYLISERNWPGVPKCIVRDSLICIKCHNEPVEDILAKVRNGKAFVREIMKLEAHYEDHVLLGVNDIMIRNVDITRALRFRVKINDEYLEGEFIADGLVIATPFGSTGYFHAITNDAFGKGIGMAFNNPVRKKDHVILKENDELTVEVTRGEAHLAADNNREIYTLGEGEKVRIHKSKEVARMIAD